MNVRKIRESSSPLAQNDPVLVPGCSILRSKVANYCYKFRMKTQYVQKRLMFLVLIENKFVGLIATFQCAASPSTTTGSTR